MYTFIIPWVAWSSSSLSDKIPGIHISNSAWKNSTKNLKALWTVSAKISWARRENAVMCRSDFKKCNNSEELAIQKAKVEESDTAWSTVPEKWTKRFSMTRLRPIRKKWVPGTVPGTIQSDSSGNQFRYALFWSPNSGSPLTKNTQKVVKSAKNLLKIQYETASNIAVRLLAVESVQVYSGWRSKIW